LGGFFKQVQDRPKNSFSLKDRADIRKGDSGDKGSCQEAPWAPQEQES